MEKQGRSSYQLTPEQEALGYRFGQLVLVHSESLNRTPFWEMTLFKSEAKNDAAALAERVTEQGWPVAELREAIQRMGGRPAGRSRADLAHQFVGILLDPGRLQRALEQLTPEERNFFVQLLVLYYSYPLKNWENQEDLPFTSPITDREAVYARFAELGLGFFSGKRFVLLDEVIRQMPPLFLPVTPAHPTMGILSADPHTLVLQAQQLLQLIQNEPFYLRPQLYWQPSPNHPLGFLTGVTPTEDSLRAIANFNVKTLPAQGKLNLRAPAPMVDDAALARWEAVLGLPPEKGEFLYHLLFTSGLIQLVSPLQVMRERGARFLALPPEQQAWALVYAYRLVANWDVCWPAWRAGQVLAQWTYRRYWGMPNTFASVSSQLQFGLRQSFLGILAFLPHDVWLSFAEVYELIKPFFLPPDGLPAQEAMNFVAFQGGWPAFQQLYLEALVRGPLHWLGLADIALEDGKVGAFRLHHLQPVLLERATALALPDFTWQGSESIRFLADEEAFLLNPPVPAGFLHQVQRWADPAGVVGGSLRYHLNSQRLHGAFESGETPETLARHWEAQAGFPVPAGLAQWWQEWWDRYGHLRLYPNQSVLIMRDEFALQELVAALPEFRQALLGTVTPRAVLLQREQVPGLIKTLQTKGYLPKEES